MNTQYDVNYFIQKFEAIPDELWCTGSFTDGDKRCAAGHCGAGRMCWPDEAAALERLLCDILKACTSNVNDGGNMQYQQPTPKARILAALHDAKAKAESALDAYETRPLLPVTKPEPVEVT